MLQLSNGGHSLLMVLIGTDLLVVVIGIIFLIVVMGLNLPMIGYRYLLIAVIGRNLLMAE